MARILLCLFFAASLGGFVSSYLSGDEAPWWDDGAYEDARSARHDFDHDLHVFHLADADHSGAVSLADWNGADGEAARFLRYDTNNDGEVVISELVPPSLGYSPANVIDILLDKTFLFTCANVFFLLFLIVHYGRGPISTFLGGRRKDIEDGLEEAKRLQLEADALRAEYEARLANLDTEMEQLRGEMLAAGEAEKNRIVEDAEAKAARMRKDASFLIDQRLKQLRDELSREAVDTAMAAAEAVLREQTTQHDQQRVADDYLARLKETSNPESQA